MTNTTEQAVTEFQSTAYYTTKETKINAIVDASRIVTSNILSLTKDLWHFVEQDKEQGVISEVANKVVQSFLANKKTTINLNKGTAFVQYQNVIEKNNFTKDDIKYLKTCKSTIENTFKAIKRVLAVDDKIKGNYFELNKDMTENQMYAKAFDKVQNIVYSFGWNTDLNMVDKKSISEDIQVFENANKELNFWNKKEELFKEGLKSNELTLEQRLESKTIYDNQEMFGRIINEAITKHFINPNHSISEDIQEKYLSLTNEEIKKAKQTAKNNTQTDDVDALKQQIAFLMTVTPTAQEKAPQIQKVA